MSTLKLLTWVLIVKVTVGIVMNYGHYLPPDFESAFLQGRDGYFFGKYQWAFYAHIFSGPSALLMGLILISQKFRRRFVAWHRRIGRIQAGNVLLLVTPSGLWMAFYAETGHLAGVGFACLALATGTCVALGWKAAMNRRFAAHERWMKRCFLLLCSAVVLRLIAGAFTVAAIDGDWTYPLAAWTSWLLPLAAFEIVRHRQQRNGEAFAEWKQSGSNSESGA